MIEDENKEKRYVKTLEETKGMKLLEVTNEMKHLIYFESLLSTSILLNHKMISCYFRFEYYLKENKIDWTENMFDYVSKRIVEENKNVLDESQKAKSGFFWLKRKELFPKKEISIPI